MPASLRFANRCNLRRFAAGEAPEQEHTQRYQRGEADVALLQEDAIQSFLDELTTVAKVSSQTRLPKHRTPARCTRRAAHTLGARRLARAPAGLTAVHFRSPAPCRAPRI